MSLTVALPAAYAFSRYSFLGDKHVFFWLLTNRMTPPAVFLLPFFQLYTTLGLMDTHIAVALAHLLFNVPLAVWILEGFMSGIPREIDETAYIDGYSFPRFFLTIFIPLIKSGIGVAAFFCFMFSWVELLMARTLTSVNAKPIVAVMTRTVSASGMDWGVLAAAGVLTIVPGRDRDLVRAPLHREGVRDGPRLAARGEGVEMFEWMAWTMPVAVFFCCIVLMLVAMTVWELKSPTVMRKGFLPIATTRGDRLFIGLLSAAYVNLAFVAVSEKNDRLVRPGAGAFDLDRLRDFDAVACTGDAQGIAFRTMHAVDTFPAGVAMSPKGRLEETKMKLRLSAVALPLRRRWRPARTHGRVKPKPRNGSMRSSSLRP